MATVASLRDHLIEELNDLLNAEQQLIEALPKMAQRASSRLLQAAFRGHLAQTRTHERRVSEALKQLGEKADGKTCQAMKGLLKEGQELMEGSDAGALRDAMMITAAQKVEHYEIATYGTVRTYAQLLGERGVAKLLAQTLKEEKAADRKLTGIAEGSVNTRASQEWHDQATASGMLHKGAEWLGSTVGRAVKTVLPGSQAAGRTPSTRSHRKRNGSGSRKRSARRR